MYRQDFKYQAVKLRERYAYGDRGIGARESGGAGHKLDCPVYAEMDDDGDGTLERRVMYLQDRAGHVIGVFDTALARQDSPTDTTLGLYPVRIAYTAFGVPVNVGASGLGLDEGLQDVNGMPGSRLDVDFDNDGFEDDRTSPGSGDDLEKLIAAVNAGSSSGCGTMINGVMQPCDTADFNRDGEVNGDDITAFIAAKQGTYYVPAGDIGDYRFLYRGYWYDPHLHIYHVRHRAYDPEIQRWLQPDPAYFVDGLNRYAYCGNEPIDYYDPLGLEKWGWADGWGTTLGYMFGGGPSGAAIQVWSGAGQGAHDGLLVTMHSGIQVITLQTFGQSRQELAAGGHLFDPENPWLAGSEVAGGVMGGALSAAGGMALGAAASGGSAAAWYANAVYSGINVGVGGYNVGGGVYSVSQGNYIAGLAQILSGGLQAAGGVHGNTVGKQRAYLYAKYDGNGVFQKWGVTADLANRYSKVELAGGYLERIAVGPRDFIIRLERQLVEMSPGPKNFESWAGKQCMP